MIKSSRVTKDGEIIFPYLEPQKYLLKAIFDRNDNGKWDTGDLKKKEQPEEVMYYLSVIKVRANWDNRDTWVLPAQKTYSKKIVDEELELEKLKNKGKKTQEDYCIPDKNCVYCGRLSVIAYSVIRIR